MQWNHWGTGTMQVDLEVDEVGVEVEVDVFFCIVSPSVGNKSVSENSFIGSEFLVRLCDGITSCVLLIVSFFLKDGGTYAFF